MKFILIISLVRFKQFMNISRDTIHFKFAFQYQSVNSIELICFVKQKLVGEILFYIFLTIKYFRKAKHNLTVSNGYLHIFLHR